MQEKDLPAKGGGRFRQRGFIHVMLFVMLFLGITTYGVVHLQEELLGIQAGQDSVTQTALQEARKGLLDYARPYPGMPQRYRDTVPIDPKYNFYTHEDLNLLQDDRYLVSRPGQLPCPDMADTAHPHNLSSSFNYNDRFLPFPLGGVNRMNVLINQEYMDEDDNMLDGISDPGTNMCSFAFLPRGATASTIFYDYDRLVVPTTAVTVLPALTVLHNGSFIGRYPDREHSDMLNFSRGAGVRDIKDGDNNGLWYAASPNVLSAHRTINPYQIIRQGRNWLTLHLVPKHPVAAPSALSATMTVTDVAAVVISPGRYSEMPPEHALGSQYHASHVRMTVTSDDIPARNVFAHEIITRTAAIFLGTPTITNAITAGPFDLVGITGEPYSKDDEFAFITKTELLDSFNGLENVNSNHLDNIADALLAYHQRNNYLPDPATFEAANGLMIARRFGRPALAPLDIVSESAKETALAGLFQGGSDVVSAVNSTDPRVSVLLGSTDEEGFRYAYQGGRVSYGYAGGTSGTDFPSKSNEKLITASLTYSQGLDVYITPEWIENSVKRTNARTAGTGLTYMLPPFASSQYVDRDPVRQAVLYARQGTEIVTVDPDTPMILARPVFMTPSTPATLSVGAGVVTAQYQVTTGGVISSRDGLFNVLFPDGRANLAGNMSRFGYQVYLPAGSVVRASITLEFLRHKTRATAALFLQDNGRAYEMVQPQAVNFEFVGVAGHYDPLLNPSSPSAPTPSAPKNAALVPGDQGLLPTPLLPHQLPNHDPHERSGTRAMDHGSFNQGAHWQRQLGAVKKIPIYRSGTHVVITDRRGLAFGYYPSKVKLHPLISHSITYSTIFTGFPRPSTIASVSHPTVNRPVIEMHPITRFAHNGFNLTTDWTTNSVEFQATTPDPATFNGWIELPAGAKFFYPFGTRVAIGPLFSQSAGGISFGPDGPLVGDVNTGDPNTTITVSLPPGTVLQDMVVGLPELRRGASPSVTPASYINHEYELVTAPGAVTVARFTLENGGVMKFNQLLHYHNGETALHPLTPAQADFRIETMGAVLITKAFPLTLTGITLASPFHRMVGGAARFDPTAMKKALNHVGEADQDVNENGFQRHIRPLDEHIPLADGYYIYPYRSTFATMSRRTYPFLAEAWRDSAGAVAHTLTIELNSASVTVAAGGAGSDRVRRYRYRNITSFIDNRGSRADVMAYATGRNRISHFYARLHPECNGLFHGADFFLNTLMVYTQSDGTPYLTVFIRNTETFECDVVPLTVVNREQLAVHRLSVVGNHGTKGRAALVDQFGVGIEHESYDGTNSSGSLGVDAGGSRIYLNFEQGVQMQANPGRIWGGGLLYDVFLQRYGWAHDTTPLVAPFTRRDAPLGRQSTITRGGGAIATLDGAASEYAILIGEAFGDPSADMLTSNRLNDIYHDSIRFSGETDQQRDNFTGPAGNRLVQEYSYTVSVRTRNIIQQVATVTSTAGSIIVQTRTIGVSETSTATPGDYRYHERRVRFSFNADATATDDGDGEPTKVTHLPRGTKLEYGVMLQPSDHNRGTCHNPNLGFTHSSPNAALRTLTVSDHTSICDNHYMPSGRLFRGIGFSPIPRRGAVVFNKPQQSIMPLAGGGTLTIGMAYVQRDLVAHICVDKYANPAGGNDFWNNGPMYNPELIKEGTGAQIYPHYATDESFDTLLNDPSSACQAGGFNANSTWMRAGSYNKTNMSLHFRTADGYGNTATIVQNSSSTDNFFDYYGQELEMTLWNVHLRVPAGAPFSPTEFLGQPTPNGRRQDEADSGKIFIDADVQLIATGYFPNCLAIRTDGMLTIQSGFLQLSTTRDPWERECQEQGSVLLSNVIIPQARILMDTMHPVTHEPVDKRFNSDELLVGPITFDRHKGKLQFYIEVEGWEDVADLQAIFPTHGGGSVIQEDNTFYGFRDYGYLWTQDYRNPTPPSWMSDIQSNQLLLYDLMQDNEGIQRIVPQLQLSWSGRESEWNSMEFRPDSLVFAQNNPMFYAVAPECRRAAALEPRGCALEAGQGLVVNVDSGQAARLPEDSLIPAGLVIHGHRGEWGVSVNVNVRSSSGAVVSHPGLFFHEDGRIETMRFDLTDIDRLEKTGTFLASTPGDELVIYNSDNGVNFRLEQATGVSSFTMARSPHLHGYLGSLTITYGGHTNGNVTSATLALTLAASVTVQARPGTEIFRDDAGMPRIFFGAGSQAVLAGNTTLSDVGGWKSTGDDFYLTAFIEGDWIEPSYRFKPPKTKDNLGGRRPIETGIPPTTITTPTTNFQVFTQPQVIDLNDTTGYAWPGFVFGDSQTRILARYYNTIGEATVLMRNYPESGQVYGPAATIQDPSTDIVRSINLPQRSIDIPIPSHYALEATSVIRTTLRAYDMTVSVYATTLSGCPVCGVHTVTLSGNGGTIDRDPFLVNSFGVVYSAVAPITTSMHVASFTTGSLSHRTATVANSFLISGAYDIPLVAMISATTRTAFPAGGAALTATTYFEDDDLVMTITITGPATLSASLAGTVSVEHQIPDPHFLNVDSTTGITRTPGLYSYAVTVSAATIRNVPGTGSFLDPGEAEIGNLDVGQIGFVLENGADYGQVITTGAGGFTVNGPVALHQTQERALTNAIIPTNLPQDAAFFYRDFTQPSSTTTLSPASNTVTLTLAVFSTATINLFNYPTNAFFVRPGVSTSTISAGVSIDVTIDYVDVFLAGTPPTTLSNGFLTYTTSILMTTATATAFVQETEKRDTASYFFDENLELEIENRGSNAAPLVGLIVPVPEVVTDRGITILAGSLLLPNYGQYGAVLHAQAFASSGLMTMFIPPGETEAHLIAAGGAGRPIMLTRPALISATSAILNDLVTVRYDIVGQDNYQGGTGPFRTIPRTETWSASTASSLLIAVKNPVVQQTIMDYRLGDAIIHRRGAQNSWNPSEAPYEDDMLSRIYPYPLPYLHRLKPRGDTAYGWELEIYQHPSISSAVTLPPHKPYVLNSWQSTTISGTPTFTTTSDGIHPEFYTGPSTQQQGTYPGATLPDENYSFYPYLRPRFGLTTKAGVDVVTEVREQTVTISSTPISTGSTLYNHVISVERTTLETGLAYDAATTLNMSLGLAATPPFDGLHDKFSVASDTYHQTFWVRLSSEITLSLSPAATVTLPVDTLINPLFGTYTLPFDFNDEPAFIEFELASRAQMHLVNTLRITRPIGVLPQGITIEFNRPATFENVKALLSYSPYPLRSTSCDSLRNGTTQAIDQTSEYAEFSSVAATHEIPDYIVESDVDSGTMPGPARMLGSSHVDSTAYPVNVGDADICNLNDLSENTDFDREFEFIDGPLFNQFTGEEIANNRMRMVGGRLRP